MQYTKDGIIERKLKQLENLIYSEKAALPEWETWQGVYSDYGIYSGIEEDHRIIRVSERWTCRDHLIRWFKREIEIPQSFAGKMVVLLLDFGGEAIVRINGEIRSAITSYLMPSAALRVRVPVSECAAGGEKLEVEIEAGMNYMEFAGFRNQGETEIEYTVRMAQLAVVDEDIEEYYFDLNTVYRAMTALRNPIESLTQSSLLLPGKISGIVESFSKDPYIFHKLKEAAASSLSCVNFDFSPDELRSSLREAGEVLRQKLKEIPSSAHAVITFVGQAHIDTAWRWTIRESVRKTAKTFSNALALMKQYPDFVFAFSQPQLFEFIKEYYPALYEKIKEKVGSGQIELVGNTWVEMDTNLPSGESLVRQLLYGRQFFLKEFGKVSKVFWMPDVFGYSWSLPQIIKRSGMEYFYTSKLCNNDTNRFPHTLFQWQGVDGTRVMSYVQRLNYNGDYGPETVNSIYNRFDQKQISENILMTFGYGDGGGGPTYQMLETGKRLKSFPGLQNTKCGTSESFFRSNEGVGEQFPLWNDEMYFEYHRGTYTSQAETKKGNRKSELLYRNAEIAASVAKNLLGAAYPYQEFLSGYKMLLTNQFHDILPGSSIRPVYEQIIQDYQTIKENGLNILNQCRELHVKHINHHIGDVVVFNCLSWPSTGVVRVPARVLQSAGTICSVEAADSGLVTDAEPVTDNGAEYLEFVAQNIPAMGYRVFQMVHGERTKTGKSLIIDKYHLETPYFILRLDSNGNLCSVYDKEAQREVMAPDGGSTGLHVFEDKPSVETAWNIDLEYQNKGWKLDKAESIEIVEDAPFEAIVRIKRKFHLSEIEQDLIVYRDSRRIDFKTRVNWQETEKMLKAEFDVDILSVKAAYEIQFGAIERPTHWNTSFDRAKFEVCGHRWADLSEGDYGVGLLNDCKYGYDIKGNRMRLTLLRSPIDPDPKADRGEHEFTYSLYPHLHDWKLGGVVNAAYELNVPLETLICSDVQEIGNLPQSASVLSCDASNVIIDTLKAAEDGNGLIIRVYEAVGKKTNAKISVNLHAEKAWECNLMEEDEEERTLNDSSLGFTIKPFEIKTFRIV